MWSGEIPTRDVVSLAFSPDSRTLFTRDGGGRVLAWDRPAGTGHELLDLSGGGGGYWATGAGLVIAPDGSRVYAPGDGDIHAADPAGGPPLPPLRPPGLRLQSPTLTPDGRTLAAAAYPGFRVTLWDTGTHDPLPVPPALQEVDGVTHAEFTADGRLLLLFRFAPVATVVVWDAAGGRVLGEFHPPGFTISPCALAPDGQTFAAVGPGRKELWLFDVPTRGLRAVVGGDWGGRAVAFHPAGRLLVTTTRTGGVAFWDARTGRRAEQYRWDVGDVRAVAFAPDGRTCAAGGRERVVFGDVGAG